MRMRNLMLLAVLSLGLGVAACQKKDETPVEKAVDAIGDATDTRDNESAKDAVEDAGDALENAGDAVKEAVGAE